MINLNSQDNGIQKLNWGFQKNIKKSVLIERIESKGFSIKD